MRLRISGAHASVAAIAPSTASAVGCPPRPSTKRTNTDFAPRALSPASIASALASRAPVTRRSRVVWSVARATMSKVSSSALPSPAAAKTSMSVEDACRARSALRGPTMLAAAASTLLGALPASRAACAAASAALPYRLSSAPIATLISFMSFSPPSSCSSARLTFASTGFCAASSIDTPCRLVIWVLASICEAPEQSFIDCRGSTAPICFANA